MNPTIYWWRKPKDPTPLEVATREYIEAQHALLGAQSEAERGNATVAMLEGRIARLRLVCQELQSDPTQARAALVQEFKARHA